MGVVYAAIDSRLRREVALKVLWPGLATRSHRIDRLRKEARAMAKLSHPNVVQIFDVGEARGHVWLAMELIDGVSLDRWLSARPRAWRDVLDVFREAGRGLAAAHAAELVHRDFKPSNVLVSEDPHCVRAFGRVKVGDFGLVRTLADPTTGATPAGQGTA